ncbi:MAG: FAD-dependent monooxygenase [Burkholderiaceae bacterium]|nr:FAD-dependent monooxygenase [Burkholderiaceae bacterium]
MGRTARASTRSPVPATRFDVIVVGRGAVGAAAALGMSQSGLRTAVLAPATERAASPARRAPRAADGEVGASTGTRAGIDTANDTANDDWDARVFALSPASRALLEGLRVWDALDAARIAPVYDMRVYPSASREAPQLRFDAYEACVDALAWIVEGRNLSAAFDRALGFSGVVAIDGRLAAIESDPANSVATVALDDGTELQARLVIGADGAHSALRSAAGIAASERPYPQRAVVANFAIGRPHRDCAYQWFGEHGILALLPLPGDRCSIVWSAPLPLADALADCDAQLLARRVDAVAQGQLGEMRLITPQQTYPLRLLDVATSIAARVALVGDAAHVVHPLAGQGMNLGLGDVQTLLDVLHAREAFRDLGDRLLLRRYERARAEAVTAMRLATDGLQRLFDPEADPPLPALIRPLLAARELGWRIVENSPCLKRRLIVHAAS